MKRAVSAVVVLASMTLLFLVAKRPEKQTVADIMAPNRIANEHSSPYARAKPTDVKAEGAEQAKAVPATIYKPTGFQIDSGGAAMEIDHGLSKQLVDTKEMRDGVNHGLPGAITLRVVDSTGNPVPGATVKGAFWNPGVKDRSFKIETDVNGEVALRNTCAGDLNFRIDKDGYYRTSLRYWFFKNGFDCVKDGRWIPWNPAVKIVLKEKRNPTRMVVKDIDIKLPLKNTIYGFDFLVGDLVAPEGKGQVADIQVKCWGDKPYPPSRNFTNELLFVSASVDGGSIRKVKDRWSEFPSDYEAPEDGYSRSFHLGTKRSETRIFEDISLSESDYLIVKVVREKKGGNGTEMWYGKLYGPLIYGITTNDREGAGVKFSYYLNPVADDRNLESDGRNP